MSGHADYQLLLVDDEANVVDGLADTLPWHELGIAKVFKAYSGVEALEILKTNPVDILISDIRMPGMTGLELLARVRRSWKKIKCILLSGHAEFAYAQQAIAHETYDYLLKPVGDEEIMAKVGGAIKALSEERDETRFRQRMARAFQESLPKLRGELLNELLQGLKYAPDRLTDKLESLKLNIAHDESFALMLVRLEGHLPKLDFYSLSLMEYAVANMAEELFKDSFRLWNCKSVHGYLVFVVTVPEEKRETFGSPEHFARTAEGELQQKAAQLQLSVSHYLKGSASVLMNKWGAFPHDVKRLYEDVLMALRRQVGNESELFVEVSGNPAQPPVRSLQRLHEPPMLVHLLESGNFDLAREKLTAVWEELNQNWANSPEHVLEVFFSVYASFSSFAHKNGRELADVIGSALADVSGLMPGRSASSLYGWMFEALQLLRQSMENETRNDRDITVNQIKQFVQKHLVDDVSLQAIADDLYMHPVHVSRVFKLETGENLSDYVLRLKMELAASMLADPSLKSYEIALKLGYQNPNYFNKVFKKYYSLTPQEYRQKQGNGGEA
ncbi:response regulator [Paenibacillus arenilitoris]|uniref:Response regulator n=1 Tax=Paenibacillus arenilitoris TaxID=2772299 RepID=A0A927CQS4_9BACL|nr:response regulator [Paenibacillus arenilitoris]MBD2871103.1 response regulator [Paenibacillus arenilitoris]